MGIEDKITLSHNTGISGSTLTINAPEQRSNARLGIIISMFPELHETFILRELVALERRGMRFDIYSLQYPRDPITLDDAIRLSSERTTYSELFTASTLMAFARATVKTPGSLVRAMAGVVWQGRDRPMDIIKNLAVLPLSLWIAEDGRKRGITHWHGHWANIPTTSCWYISRIFGQSWSAAIHGEDIFSPNRFLQHKLNEARFCVVCSGYFCNHLQQKMGLDHPEHVHLNYHGLDPRVMQRADQREARLAVAGEALSIVSIGRLVPTKGHDVLIKACKLLRAVGIPIKVQIIGSGPLEDELNELVAASGLSDEVTFLGALAFEQVLETLEMADVFALAPRLIPGHPPDGIPNVIAEAMALGIPVVTTRVSAIPELVGDAETGVLVEVDDVEGFARALESLYRDPQRAVDYSAAARDRVARLFNQDANINELLGHFKHYVPDEFIPTALPDT